MRNDHLVLIAGQANTGKSVSLRNLKEHERVLYINTEAGKRLPFKYGFNEVVVTLPEQVAAAITKAEKSPKNYHTIVVDSLTHLIRMYERLYVDSNKKDGFGAWAKQAGFIQGLFQDAIPNSSKTILLTAHTVNKFSEEAMVVESKIPVSGATKNIGGIEAFFSIIVTTKRMLIPKLEEHVENCPMLNITDAERAKGYKYVFQVQHTADTMNESHYRAPFDFWEPTEYYMDNDAQLLIQRLNEYYGIKEEEVAQAA